MSISPLAHSASNPCPISANPDISGIGVRAAIYAQNLLGFVPALSALWDGRVASYELEAVETQSTTMLITAFAILIAAMVQVHIQALSIFHASIILNLSWMNNTNTFIYFLLYIQRRSQLGPHQIRSDISSFLRRIKAWFCGSSTLSGDGGPSRRKIRSNPPKGAESEQRTLLAAMFQIEVKGIPAIAILGSLHLTLMSVLGVWLWSRPISVGCAFQSSTYAILGHDIPLRSKGLRIVSLVIYTIFLAPGINLLIPMGAFLSILLLYSACRGAYHANEFDSGSRRDLRSAQDATTEKSLSQSRSKGLMTLHLRYNPFLLPIIAGLVLLFAVNVAFVINIELTLHHNRGLLRGDESAWTFGQTLAVLLLALPLRDLRVFSARRDFTSSLQNAVQWQASTEVLRDLVRRGADVNLNAGGSEYPTALLVAVSRRDVDFTRMLLVYGANPNVRDETGRTALQAASLHESLEISKLLLANGADPNAEGGEYGTALQAAASSGNLEIVRLLLEHGADVNVEGGRHGTALQAALDRGFGDVVEVLRAHGAIH